VAVAMLASCALLLVAMAFSVRGAATQSSAGSRPDSVPAPAHTPLPGAQLENLIQQHLALDHSAAPVVIKPTHLRRETEEPEKTVGRLLHLRVPVPAPVSSSEALTAEA